MQLKDYENTIGCSHCADTADELVQLTIYYNGADIHLCKSCLKKALELLDKVES